MANNEGVDIIIKATDQYTKTINNITASNELFGKSVKNLEKEIAALEKYMISLKVNGMDTTSVGFKILQEKLQSLNSTLNQTKNSVNGVDSALAATGNNLKKNNQQWTNLSLVIQDLPYGFRGIQNNLPALLGGFAAVTGPIYLAFSAIIAVLTVMDDKMQRSASAAKKLKEEQGNLNEEILQSTQSAREQGILLKSYIDIANDATLSDNTRNEALKKANELYGEHNQKLTLANINTKAVKESVDGYIQSLIQMAVAQKYSDQVANNIIKNDKIQAQIDKKKEQSYALLLEYTGKQTLASRDVVDVMYDRRVVEAEVAKLEEQKAANAKELTVLTDKYSKSLVLATELSAKFGKIEEKKGGKSQEQLAKDKLKAIENANNAEIKAFTETLDERDKKEYEAGLKLAENLQAMRSAGYTDSTTYYTAYRAQMAAIDTFYNDKQIEEARKTSEKVAKDAEIIDNRQLQNSLDALKIESDVAMKIANLSGNANASDRIKILEDYKNGLYDLASIGGYTAEQFDRIDDAIKRVDGAIEGSKDRVKNYTITWQETVNNINGILNNLDVSLITNFAEQIGNMMAGGKFDISQMGTILADALSSIGKALIAYAITNGAVVELFKNPKSWPLALAAGIAAVAAGTALKSKINNNKATAFANGGIVSGPTMGLVGEYPGAQSNPEVIAPLDKLKEMIGGGGGGAFVLRGQDLLLSVNRAQKASNLKGQNISLA
jgi:hypothetical protein